MEEINKRSGSGASASLILCFTDGMESNSIFRYSHTSTNPGCCRDVSKGRAWIQGNTANGTESVEHELLGCSKVPSTVWSRWKPWQVTTALGWMWTRGGAGVPCGPQQEGGRPARSCRRWWSGCAHSSGPSETCSGQEDALRGARGLAWPSNPHPASALPDTASPEPWLKRNPLHSGISYNVQEKKPQ